MAGIVPAIHVRRRVRFAAEIGVDHRVEPGDDDCVSPFSYPAAAISQSGKRELDPPILGWRRLT
jgi:hypothetical protein